MECKVLRGIGLYSLFRFSAEGFCASRYALRPRAPIAASRTMKPAASGVQCAESVYFSGQEEGDAGAAVERADDGAEQFLLANNASVVGHLEVGLRGWL